MRERGLPLTEFNVNSESSSNNGEKKPAEASQVECPIHGYRESTFVCQHLVSGEGIGVCVGFDPENPLALYPDAWCEACERRRAAAGEWTDEVSAAADIKLLCSRCYIKACARNWIEDSEAYETLVCGCMDRLEAAQADLFEQFSLNDWERWDWDMEKQELVFSHEGRKRVIASVAFVGTYSTKSCTWMWAWGNESLPEQVRTVLSAVKSAGEETGYRRLALGHWAAEEHDGWHMTAYAFDVLGGLGAYRTPSDNGYVYMVIRDAARLQ